MSSDLTCRGERPEGHFIRKWGALERICWANRWHGCHGHVLVAMPLCVCTLIHPEHAYEYVSMAPGTPRSVKSLTQRQFQLFFLFRRQNLHALRHHQYRIPAIGPGLDAVRCVIGVPNPVCHIPEAVIARRQLGGCAPPSLAIGFHGKTPSIQLLNSPTTE